MRIPALPLALIVASLAPTARGQTPCFEDDRPITMPGNSAPGMALGDVDGDGDLDLVAPHGPPLGFQVLRNLGDGSFAPGEPYAPSWLEATDAALSDLDGDGDLDALFANRATGNHSVVLWRNAGDGQFSAWTTLALPAGATPYALTVGDLDGDGDPDVISANFARDTISVLQNQGSGVFAPHVDYFVGDGPRSLALGDVDGDGDLDVVVVNLPGQSVSILANGGTGLFVPHATIPTALGPSRCRLGDLDGDGDPDLAVASVFQNSICVHTNVSGSFAPFVPYSTGFITYDAAIGDLDGDGDLDMVGACYDSALAVFENLGSGFAAPQMHATTATTVQVLCGDLDRDGDLDLVARNGTTGFPPSSVSVLRNCASSGRATCSGDGTGTPCPCSPGGAGRGCPTSFEPLGARLSGSGRAQVGADGLVLACEDATTSVVLFFQGSAPVGGGLGAVFGDGLRCAGGATIRLATVQSSGGDATYPAGPGDAAVSVLGQMPASGGTRVYQVWFRNAADYCTSATFNLTNGIVLAWAP